MNLNTYAQKTWCPGCGNFGIENAFKKALIELEKEGLNLKKIVIITGIGCHGKIADYLNLNSFYSLHGRTIPVATGIKLANKNLIPICFAGDGDIYSEGLEHLIFAAKRNSNIKVFVHNNRVFSLTTGQFTPTSPKGFISKSSPKGSVEKPINPIELMIACDASFVARGYVGQIEHLKELMKKAIQNNGFSFIDILQPCIVYFNTYEIYNKFVYQLEKENHNFTNYELALKKAREWDYQNAGRIPIGVFYQSLRPTFEENV